MSTPAGLRSGNSFEWSGWLYRHEPRRQRRLYNKSAGARLSRIAGAEPIFELRSASLPAAAGNPRARSSAPEDERRVRRRFPGHRVYLAQPKIPGRRVGGGIAAPTPHGMPLIGLPQACARRVLPEFARVSRAGHTPGVRLGHGGRGNPARESQSQIAPEPEDAAFEDNPERDGEFAVNARTIHSFAEFPLSLPSLPACPCVSRAVLIVLETHDPGRPTSRCDAS